MVLIAVAGGTSPTLGRAIVTAISENTRNTAIILSSQTNLTSKHGAEVRTVDYSSLASLSSALQDIHTVISVVKIQAPQAVEYETNLLYAAKDAGVKRFAPSAFENGPLATERVTILSLNKPAVWQACLDSGLEVARFSGGLFMNYLALGSKREEAEQGLVDAPIIWNIPAGKIEMPVKDDGTAPRLTTTSLRDIGRFVAAACELLEGSWRENMEMVGETVGIDEVTALIEGFTRRKVKVITVGRKELQRRADGIEGIGSTREEILTKMVSEINLLVLEEKEGMCLLRPVVNGLCPDIKPMSVREMLEEAWS